MKGMQLYVRHVLSLFFVRSVLLNLNFSSAIQGCAASLLSTRGCNQGAVFSFSFQCLDVGMDKKSQCLVVCISVYRTGILHYASNKALE
jgi:hypothetical protein